MEHGIRSNDFRHLALAKFQEAFSTLRINARDISSDVEPRAIMKQAYTRAGDAMYIEPAIEIIA